MTSVAGWYAQQGFTDGGDPLVGGRLYTYAQGTTTHKTAYTDKAGVVPHTYTSDGGGGQYIALNARGELPAPLYLASGAYDMALKRADDSTVWTRRADPGDEGAENVTTRLASSASSSDGAGMVGFGPALNYPAGTVGASLARWLHIAAFGAVGDGSTDDATAFVNALAQSAALGLPLVLDGAKTYAIGALTLVVSDGTAILGNGATLLCSSTTSNTPWMQAGDNVTIDRLNASVPTGVQRNRGVTVGSNCEINRLSIESADQQANDADSFAFRMLGDRSVARGLRVQNYDRAIRVQGVGNELSGLEVESYMLGLYLVDASHTKASGHIHTASPNASLTEGHNGVLVSCETVGTSHDNVLEDLVVENSGEHGFRVGGPFPQWNTHLVRPVARKTGGSGIKILGTNAITPTDRNYVVYLDNPVCEDIGSGTLGENESGILVMHVDGVVIANPKVRKRDNTYSSYACLRVVATTDVSVINPQFEDAQIDAVWLDGSESGDDNDRFTLTGGYGRGCGQDGFRVAAGANTVRRFNVDGYSADSNGRYAFNIAIGGSGALTDSVLKIKAHNNASGAGACDSAAVFMDVWGSPGATPISGITAGNGSTWHDGTTVNIRKAGAWVAL